MFRKDIFIANHGTTLYGMYRKWWRVVYLLNLLEIGASPHLIVKGDEYKLFVPKFIKRKDV